MDSRGPTEDQSLSTVLSRDQILTVCEEIVMIFMNIYKHKYEKWSTSQRWRMTCGQCTWKKKMIIPLWGYLEKAWNETVTASGKWSTACRMLEYHQQNPTGRKAGFLWKAHISCLALRPSWDSRRTTEGMLVAISQWIHVQKLCENKWVVGIDVPVP